MAPSNHARVDKIIVGIDFGTTFSGAAWAYSGAAHLIEVVTSFEAEHSHCSDIEKTPTKLCYDSDHNVVSWGAGVPPGADAISWFKLLLLKAKDVPSDVAASDHFSQTLIAQKKLGMTAVELVGDYLGKLWEKTLESIEDSCGKHLVSRCDFRVTISVPAIWPCYANDLVREAAAAAGITTTTSRTVKVDIISEPEAATLATFKDMAGRSDVEVGDIIIVCDAGGGTVDVISYRIESISPLRVGECVKGNGGLCGGIFLDEEFLKVLKSKLDKRSTAVLEELRGSAFLNDAWEHSAKTQFKNQERTWVMGVPSKVKSVRGKVLKNVTMSRQDLFNVFDPVVRQIEALVDEQNRAIRIRWTKDAKFLVLAGGFGRNGYLFQRLKEAVGDKMTVLQSKGSNPWTAVSRGAVIHGLLAENIATGLHTKVTSRIARMSCGFVTDEDWDPNKHHKQDRVWNKDWRQWHAQNQMSWFLHIGDDMDELKPIRKPFVGLLRTPHHAIDKMLHVSRATQPSKRLDQTVSVLCNIKWHTRNLDKPIPTWTNPVGKVFWKLEFEVEMTAHGGNVEFAVYHGSQKLGSQHVAVEFH